MESGKRIKRLMEVASLYYEADETQGEIARKYGISRPMVSRLLKEAKEAGVLRTGLVNYLAAPGQVVETALAEEMI